MVKSGQSDRGAEIRPVGFSPTSTSRIEALDLAFIQKRRWEVVPGGNPERINFELLIVVTEGKATHKIDFEDVALQPGRLVRIRPGQVHQWVDPFDAQGWGVLARAETSPKFTVDSPAIADLDEQLAEVAANLIDGIARLSERPGSDMLTLSLWRSLNELFDLAAETDDRELPPAYVAFRRAIDEDPAKSRHAQDYILDLGWSERTVRRACLDIAGQTPKQLLDERLILEAKRLLAHTDRSAASISTELGFSEATNFQKFFVRLVGTTPTSFRASTRITASPASR